MAGLGGAGGSGSDAGAIEAGKAFVRFGVKDQTGTDLAKIGAKFAAAGAAISKAFEGGAIGKLSEAGRSGGFKTAGLVGVGVAIAAVADRFNRVNSIVDRLGDAMDLFQIKVFGAATGTNTLARETEALSRQSEKVVRTSDRASAAAERRAKFTPEDINKLPIFEKDENRLRQASVDAEDRANRAFQIFNALADSPLIPHSEVDRLRQQMDEARANAEHFRDALAGAEDRVKGLKQQMAASSFQDFLGIALRIQGFNGGMDEIRRLFFTELEGARMSVLTQNLSPESARLAGLISQGLSDEQILAIQSAGRMGGDITTAGGFAGDLSSRSIGFAQETRRNQQLTLETLQDMRRDLADLTKNLRLKN